MPKRITKADKRMRPVRAAQQLPAHTRIDVGMTGRRRRKDTPNSLSFLVHIEGVEEFDGRVRAANGVRWRVIS